MLIHVHDILCLKVELRFVDIHNTVLKLLYRISSYGITQVTVERRSMNIAPVAMTLLASLLAQRL